MSDAAASWRFPESQSPVRQGGAVSAETEAGQRRDQVREALERDLEAARFVADRAFRQYDAADPANRLVAGELETRWNKALAHVAEVEGKIAAHNATTPTPAADPVSFVALAADLKNVWTAPLTDARLKKRIVRTVIHEVIADIDQEAAEVLLVVHWIGGVHSEIRLPRRRRGQRKSTSADVITAVRQLVNSAATLQAPWPACVIPQHNQSHQLSWAENPCFRPA